MDKDRDGLCHERGHNAFLETPHELSNIGKIIGVNSGKGGVGKSLVTSLLAILMQRRGFKTAILDADVTGPSIPKTFGIREKAVEGPLGLFPVKSESGISVMSLNLLLEHDTDPIVWRGPLIAGAVKRFWTDVVWGDVDFLFVDMPPGTGDVSLTVFQSIPLDGVIVVTSPQALVGMIVEKAVKMAGIMQIPVLALVENMSYYECPDCGRRHDIFGKRGTEELARRHGIDLICKIPVNPGLYAAVDAGTLEEFDGNWLDDIVELLERGIEK